MSIHCYRCSRCGALSRVWEGLLRFTTAAFPRPACRDFEACKVRAANRKPRVEVWLDAPNAAPAADDWSDLL